MEGIPRNCRRYPTIERAGEMIAQAHVMLWSRIDMLAVGARERGGRSTGDKDVIWGGEENLLHARTLLSRRPADETAEPMRTR